MEIKYVGPRALISTSGVSFDNEKSDKFIYLYSLLQLMQAVDHEYDEGKVYTFVAEGGSIKSGEIMKMVRQFCPDAEEVIARAKKEALNYVDENVKRAVNTPFLSGIEAGVLMNNLTLMQDYTVQRYINKRIYYHMVNKLIARLRHHRVSYISAPVHATYFHVFNTLQRGLRQLKSPVSSDLSFYKKGEEHFVKLNIRN